MSRSARRPIRVIEEWGPVAAVLALSSGVMVFLAGIAMDKTAVTFAGSATAAAALVLLVAGGWINGLPLLALALPLPAVVSSDFARITPAAILTAVVLLAWFLAHAAAGRRAVLKPLPGRSVTAFIGAVVIATLFAQHPAAAARELVNLLLMIGLLAVATSELARSPGSIRPLMKAVAAAAGLAGVYALLQTFGVVDARFSLAGTAFFRATAGFGWPNEFGMFMAVALPLCVHLALAAHGLVLRAVWSAVLVVAAAGLAVTFSRGSWLAFLTAAPILLFGGGRRFAWKALAAVAIGIVVIDLVLGGALRERALATANDPYVAQRLALMLTGVLMFVAHPITGVGPGGFAESLGEFGPRVPWLWDYVGSSHNAFIEMAAETGVLGLAAFLALLGTTLLAVLRSARQEERSEETPSGLTARKALLWSFATVCTASFTVWPFAHGIGQLAVLVAAMGLVVAHRPLGDAP